MLRGLLCLLGILNLYISLLMFINIVCETKPNRICVNYRILNLHHLSGFLSQNTQQFSLQVSLFHKYLEYYRTYGDTAAYRMIQATFHLSNNL